MTAEDAVEIGRNFLGISSTRNGAKEEVSVINRIPTGESTVENFPLGYIVNYGEDEGFVIVSTVDTVNPVIAYSDQGHFRYNTIMTKERMSRKLQAWSYDYGTIDTLKSEDWNGVFDVKPKLQMVLGQRDPWNKFLPQEFAGMPTGCVPTAVVNVMVHCKDAMTYHGGRYDNDAIRSAIYAFQNGKSKGNAIAESTPSFRMFYGEAVDSVAKLMAWVGKDLSTTYMPNRSTTYRDSIVPFLKKMKFSLTDRIFRIYQSDKVAKAISDGYIIIISGASDPWDVTKLHTWLIDGVKYKVKDGKIYNVGIDFHCDFGLNGENNGYYRGSVFMTNTDTEDGWVPGRYLGVMVEGEN